MLIELSDPVITVINFTAIPTLQMGLAWLSWRLPPKWFDRPLRPTRDSSCFYERVFRIRSWKDLLPDGGAWFAHGFKKARLTHTDSAYLREFVRETRRGEFCHWLGILIIPVFYLWNPLWAGAVITFWLLLANLPCLLVQRYTRIKLVRVLLARQRKSGARSIRS